MALKIIRMFWSSNIVWKSWDLCRNALPRMSHIVWFGNFDWTYRRVFKRKFMISWCSAFLRNWTETNPASFKTARTLINFICWWKKSIFLTLLRPAFLFEGKIMNYTTVIVQDHLLFHLQLCQDFVQNNLIDLIFLRLLIWAYFLSQFSTLLTLILMSSLLYWKMSRIKTIICLKII